MSDFLTRMAQLSRGEATVVAPRLPSLFAPTQEAGLTETIESTLQYQTKAEPAVQKTHESAAATVDKDPSQPSTFVEHAAEPSISTKQASRLINNIEEAPTPLITPQNYNHPMPSIAVQVKNHNQETATTSQQDSIHKQTTKSLKEKLQTLFPTDVDVAFDTDETLTEQPGSVKPQSSLPLVPGYKNQQTTPQQFITELPAATEEIPKKKTSVHINIGRVEVRAQTTAPAPAPRLAQPKTDSNLSLNDYLKRSEVQS